MSLSTLKGEPLSKCKIQCVTLFATLFTTTLILKSEGRVGCSRKDTDFTNTCDFIITYAVSEHSEQLKNQIRKGCQEFYATTLRSNIHPDTKTVTSLPAVRTQFVVHMIDCCSANESGVTFEALLQQYKETYLPKLQLFNRYLEVFKKVDSRLYLPDKSSVVLTICNYVASNAGLPKKISANIVNFTTQFMTNPKHSGYCMKDRLCKYVNTLRKHLERSSNSGQITVDKLLTMFKKNAHDIYPRLLLPSEPASMRPVPMMSSNSSASSSTASSASSASVSLPRDTQNTDLKKKNHSLQDQLKRQTDDFEALKKSNHSLQDQLKRQTDEFEALKKSTNRQLKRKTDEFKEQQKETDRFKYQKTELQNRTKILMTICEKHQKLGEAQQRVNEAQQRVNEAQRRVNEAQRKVNERRQATDQQFQHKFEQWERMDRQV